MGIDERWDGEGGVNWGQRQRHNRKHACKRHDLYWKIEVYS